MAESQCDRDVVRGGENTMDDDFEVREIVVAQGIERTNSEFDEAKALGFAKGDNAVVDRYTSIRIPQGLAKKLPAIKILANDEAEYRSTNQQVTFKIRVVNTKDDFIKALETPKLHVIYAGHARYGRGPCFGKGAPTVSGEDWEQGGNPAKQGLFRMGFPVIAVHFNDIRDHAYSFSPVPENVTIQDNWRHPELPAKLDPIEIPSDLASKVLPAGQSGNKYWGFRDKGGEGVILYAGWKDTNSKPHELNTIKINCRCFCCFGCSTFIHWYPILRKRYGWTRTEDERFAYFTRRPSTSFTTLSWIVAVLSYDKSNKNQSWYKSLQWAVGRANQMLDSSGYGCGII